MSEFEIIKKYFADAAELRSDVQVGIGDDAAITTPPPGQQLAITTDTLISGVHFLADTLPFDIAYKSLAVNLSDLAAMGATPAWITLALTLPHEDKTWLQKFSEGFFTLAKRHRVQLIGGDLTRGPLSITIQAIGFTPSPILRSQAKSGDLIYVTGTLGDAGLALQILKNKIKVHFPHNNLLLQRLNFPEPRIEIGIALRNLANSAIDISDGLTKDLSHILMASGVGAEINVDHLPLSNALTESVTHEEAIKLALTAGDDYELCFTVPAQNKIELEKKLSKFTCRFTQIGTITSSTDLHLHFNNGKKYNGTLIGYQHF